jgi:hypothetical protein
VTGDFATSLQAADFFVDHLHDYRRGDVPALDNEVLDDSTRLWDDSEGRAHVLRLSSMDPRWTRARCGGTRGSRVCLVVAPSR